MATTLLRTTRTTTTRTTPSHLLSLLSLLPRLTLFSPSPSSPSYVVRISTTTLPPWNRIGAVLEGLRGWLTLPPIVWAVPKSKTSHSKKSMRSAGKGLKQRTNLVGCPSCGLPKPSHMICHECHVAFRKEIHAEAKMLRKG